MRGIFISYRRQDSQSAAGRLADHLKEHMPGVPIFRDVETIEPGVDFVDAIGRALACCGVLLAVIGPRWSRLEDTAGKPRLDDPNDYTRLEIATALGRADVRVIPVLVEGAQMPAGAELPDNLQALARRNAVELTDTRWEYDVSRLVDTLNKALAIAPVAEPPPPGAEPAAPAKPPGAWKKWAWGMGGVLVVIAAILGQEEDTPTGTAITDGPGLPAPAPVAPGSGGAVATVDLSGAWQDAEGGRYRMAQQGHRIAFEGMSPHGPVLGGGLWQDNRLILEYTLNGYPYRAALALAPDGSALSGQFRDPATGQSGPVLLQRVR